MSKIPRTRKEKLERKLCALRGENYLHYLYNQSKEMNDWINYCNLYEKDHRYNKQEIIIEEKTC